MNGLDLFSGIGGLSLALDPWIRTVAYCERDLYAQSVLLSRMAEGSLHRAPIWDDVQTLTGEMLPSIDIIFGGFPCQDISVAGPGEGLGGKRSGLFFEIMRLAEETRASFLFLENVPAIRTRGASVVGKELAERGYDCRWSTLSAQEVGANHRRERWFLFAAHADRAVLRNQQRWGSGKSGQGENESRHDGAKKSMAHAKSGRLQSMRDAGDASLQPEDGSKDANYRSGEDNLWWEAEPDVGRVVDGLPFRVDRLRCLGNAVVPLQARKAFKELSGMKEIK